MTDKMKQEARKEFAAMLDSAKMADGKLSFRKKFKYDDCKATVWLSQDAYRKTLALVTQFTDEVGWHGTVARVSDNEFLIQDVFVYPQEVTGATVNTDQAAYTDWLYSQPDEVFGSLRMQGHSHCNMGVTPSGVDDKHRQQILDQLETGMFYIFMVWNKSLAIHTLIYDMEKNILYEDKDVDVKLVSDEDMDAFLEDAHEKVKKLEQRKTRSASKPRAIAQVAACNDDFFESQLHRFCGTHGAHYLGGDYL
jgi:hypothetical protein